MSAVRAGDDERERAVALLRDHCARGRLEIEELDQRVAAAYTAATRTELDRLLADLPDAESSPPVTQARLWWPGVTAFHIERRLRAGNHVTFQEALRVIVPRMAMTGFHLSEEVPPRRLTFRTDDGLRVGVLLHPAGDGGTLLAAFGEAPRSVRKAFAALRD